MPTHDSCTAAVWIQNERDFVAYQHADPMEPHFASEIRQNLLAAVKGDSKERIRKAFGHLAVCLIRCIFRAYHLIVVGCSDRAKAIIPERTA
jgi:hypothetical protein